MPTNSIYSSVYSSLRSPFHSSLRSPFNFSLRSHSHFSFPFHFSLHFKNIFRLLGLLLIGYSITFLVPILIAVIYHEFFVIHLFLKAAILTFCIGALMWLPFRKATKEIRVREGFLIVTLLWVAFSAASALPFGLSTTLSIPWVDAVFEAVSGLTTTGATILTGLDTMPRAILFYRQQLQFIGGGGIILLAIAILPLLGVGGMQLYRAEMTGPFKEEKLTPRIRQTGKALWMIYVGLVLICAICFWLGGMSLFDAISHSFATISTGGFSTHDSSFMYFNNHKLQIIAIFFMILGASNFALHFTLLARGSIKHYWQDSEFKTFCLLILIVAFCIFVPLLIYNAIRYYSVTNTIINSLFQSTAFITTTGFFSAPYYTWPTFVPTLLLLVCLIGGCAGSTAGGIKILRALILSKQGLREIQRLIHPNGHYVIKLGPNRVHHRALDALWGFFGVFTVVFAILLIFLMATGLDFLSAFSSLAATVSSTGVGLGIVSDHFQKVNEFAKCILIFAMLAGRLEFFTLLVLLVPSYWRS